MFLCLALAVALHTSLTISWIIILVGLLVSIASPDRRNRLQILKTAPLALPLLLFCAAIALSVIVSTTFNSAANVAPHASSDWRDYFANIRGFLIYFYLYQIFARVGAGAAGAYKCEQAALIAFVATGSVAGVWGAVQQIFNYHPFTYPYLQGTGFLNAPMPYAGLMQLSSFLSLGLLIKKSYVQFVSPFSNRIFFAFIVVANFLGLFFACERSAWLGMIAGLALITLCVSPRLFFKSALAGFTFLLLAWFCIPAVQARLSPLAHWQSDLGVTTRMTIWQRSLTLFMAHPLTGVGPTHFPRITDIPEALVPGHSTDFNHAHSNYFQILSTLGLIGFAAYFYLWVAALRTALVNSKSLVPNGLNAGLGLGTLAAVVSLMVAGVFEYNFGTAQVKLASWFLLAALKPARQADLASKSSALSSPSIDSAP